MSYLKNYIKENSGVYITEKVDEKILNSLRNGNEVLKGKERIGSALKFLEKKRDLLFGKKRTVIEVSYGDNREGEKKFFSMIGVILNNAIKNEEIESFSIDEENFKVIIDGKERPIRIISDGIYGRNSTSEQYKVLSDNEIEANSIGIKEKYRVLISGWAEDIAGMSTDRAWGSCKEFSSLENKRSDGLSVQGGSHTDSLKSEIGIYGIAYLVKGNDGGIDGQGEIAKPIGRINLYPVSFNSNVGKGIKFRVSDKVYGLMHGVGNSGNIGLGKFFKGVVDRWLEGKQGKIVGSWKAINLRAIEGDLKELPYHDDGLGGNVGYNAEKTVAETEKFKKKFNGLKEEERVGFKEYIEKKSEYDSFYGIEGEGMYPIGIYNCELGRVIIVHEKWGTGDKIKIEGLFLLYRDGWENIEGDVIRKRRGFDGIDVDGIELKFNEMNKRYRVMKKREKLGGKSVSIISNGIKEVI